MAAAVGTPPRTIVDQSTQNVWLLRAVSSETAVLGVVAINIGRGSLNSSKSKEAASRLS